MSLPSFPAEHLLQTDLPNWEWELLRLKCLVAVAAIIWLFGMPWALSTVVKTPTDPHKKWFRVPRYAGVVGLFGFFVTAAALVVFVSPYNVYTSRRVFQVPILTKTECQRIIDMAFAAAERNVVKLSGRDDLNEIEEKVLEDPAGWQKWRHSQYPTNDLNLVTDPFTAEDQDWLRKIANQRLAPILSRIYGIPARSIQARDMFVVRYDADTERSKLPKHIDDGDISFTIFLNNEFEGGGTQFWNRDTNEPFALLQSDSAGHLSTFPARIEHEGYPTTKGRRMILVGFLNVVRYDEDEKTPTGLSLAASWGNLNWAMGRIQDAYSDYAWESHKLRIKVYRAIRWTMKWHDRLSSHSVVPSLVKQEQLSEFLEVLDKSYDGTNRASKARWLEGQQKKALLSFLDQWKGEGEYDAESYGYEDVQEEL